MLINEHYTYKSKLHVATRKHNKIVKDYYNLYNIAVTSCNINSSSPCGCSSTSSSSNNGNHSCTQFYSICMYVYNVNIYKLSTYIPNQVIWTLKKLCKQRILSFTRYREKSLECHIVWFSTFMDTDNSRYCTWIAGWLFYLRDCWFSILYDDDDDADADDGFVKFAWLC